MHLTLVREVASSSPNASRLTQPSIPLWVSKNEYLADDGNLQNMCIPNRFIALTGKPNQPNALYASQGVDLRGWLLLIKEWHSERPEPGVKCYCKMPLIRWKICGKLLYKWGTLTFFNIILGIEKASGHAWLQLVSCMLPCWTHVRTLSVLFTSKLASDGYHSAVYLCYCLLFSQGYFVVDVIAYYWACSACMFCHPSSTCVA